MGDEDTGKNEYIYDCDDYQLAVKVGIVGILIGFVHALLYRAVWFVFVESSPRDYNLYTLQLNLLYQLSFVGTILISVGYVGVFSMKESNLGILFPIFAIISTYGIRVYQFILLRIGLYSFEIYILPVQVLLFAITLVGGFALLTLRRVSANPQFLYIFVFFSIIDGFLVDGLWILVDIIMTPLPISGGLGSLIYALPHLSMYFVFSLLLVKFFLLERKQGCIDSEHQEVLFHE